MQLNLGSIRHDGAAKAKHTPVFFASASFRLSLSTTSMWREMNLNASRADFPAIQPRAGNCGDNTSRNFHAPDFWQKSSDFLLYKHQLFTWNCFVVVEHRGVNGFFVCCRDRFVDDRFGKASELQMSSV